MKKDDLVEADAVVLSILPQNKLLVQVLPLKARNFVTEIRPGLPIPSDLHAGQRIRIKYDPAHHCKIEIKRFSLY